MQRASSLPGLTFFILLFAVSMLYAPAASAATAYSVIVDDYTAPSDYSVPFSIWRYSRMGTDRGAMGDEGGYTVNIANGSATVTMTAGWGSGIWTSLLHRDTHIDMLDPTKLFGPYIKPEYQAHITGVEADILDGSGTFTIEFLNKQNVVSPSFSFTLNGGPQSVSFNYSPTENDLLKKLNWFVSGPGPSHVTVDEIRLLVSSPDYKPEQAIFLFSYGHLSQCYDPATGLVWDQAVKVPESPEVPEESVHKYAIQSTGMFALATAAAYQLGYVEKSTAEDIVKKTTAALKKLQTNQSTGQVICHGLLPHFVTYGKIAPGSEWSSIDTVIALTANLLAAQYLNLRAEVSDLQAMLQNIDWHDLTYGYTSATAGVSMGYKENCGEKLQWNWGTFGSEIFLIAEAFSAVNPDKEAIGIKDHEHPPTWDGSGFNDELAALFFPMRGTDYWSNDWKNYRSTAFDKQRAHFSGNQEYSNLFGLSACEVPETWAVTGNSYWAFGVGGHSGNGPVDGTATIPGCSYSDCPPVVGYPIVAPHYAAMICKEQPSYCRNFFNYLISQHIFSPLNNTESLGIKDSSVKWSSSKGSWNLSMQALGAARALSGNEFAPYQALCRNPLLLAGYNKLMPNQDETFCPASLVPVYDLLLSE